MDIWSIILLAGILQGLFLLLVFYTKRSSTETGFLKLFIWLFLLTDFDYWLISSGLYRHFSWPIGISNGFIYLLGPALYFYIRHHLKGEFSLRRSWPHFLPFLLFKLMDIPLFLIDHDTKRAFVNLLLDGELPLRMIDNIIFTIQVVHFMIYTGMALKVLAGNRGNNTAQTGRTWLYAWVTIMAVYGLTVSGLVVFCVVRGSYHIVANYTYASIMSLATYGMAYAAMLQPTIVFSEKKEKYSQSPMDDVESTALALRAKEYYEEKKVYLDSSIRLSSVARDLSSTPQKLSQAINQHYGSSFNDWTNKYRIEHVKSLLSDPETLKKQTIYAIALDSGFNSKSAFNEAFRKHNGMTPSAYAEQQKSVRNDNSGR